MDLRAYLEESLFPRVRADGGWLEWAGQIGDAIELTAKGECAQCACLDACLDWIRQRILTDRGEDLSVRAAREPFIWRK